MIQPVAPAETVEAPTPLFEKCKHLRQRLKCLDAIAGVVPAARMRPARIAFLGTGAEQYHVDAPLRPARAAERNVEWKEDFVKACHCSKSALATRDRARDLASQVGFRSPETLRVRCHDLHRDGRGLPCSARGDSKPAVGPAREWNDRLRPSFARKAQSRWRGKIRRRADDAAGRERDH